MGRPVGSRNRPKRQLLALLREEFPGYHPVISMARIAHKTDDEALAASMHDKVASYVVPKLKAIDLTADFEGEMVIRWIDGADSGDSLPAPTAPGDPASDA